MKIHFDGQGHATRSLVTVMLLALMVTLTAVLPSCRHGSSSSAVNDRYHVQLDSVLGMMRDPDSLAALAAHYHQRGDQVGEMMALKRQGQVLCVASRHDEAIKSFNECLDLATAIGDTIEMVNAVDGLGMVYRRMDNLSLAHGYLYKAMALSDRYSNPDNPRAQKARVSVLNNICNIEIESYDYQDADSIDRLALAIVQRMGNNNGIARNYAYLGLIKQGLGETDSAWAYFRRSMEYNELVGNRMGAAMCHLHYGSMHEQERRFSHAIEEYEMAYDALKQMNDSWHWVEAGLALTRVYILMGEAGEAHRYLEEAKAEAQRIGSRDYQSEASMLHYELSLLQGNTQEALEHYIRGTRLLDSIHGLEQGNAMRSQRIEYERNRSIKEMDGLNRDINKLKRSSNMQMLFSMVFLLMSLAAIGALVYAVRVRMRTQQLMRQVEETRSLFFTNVVHQLRTPLTAIMGSIDHLLADDSGCQNRFNETERKNAVIIERQGKNLLSLVDRILEVGSVRSAIMEPEWRRGDVVTFIRMVVEPYREMCASRHIEIAYTPQEASVEVVIVPRYLSTIIGNLLENAISYCNDYGKIIVTTSVENGFLTITVADDGIGISKNDLPHVFEPFYRSATAEQLVDGIGIGLTVVRDMAMSMGGTVDVESEKNHGAKFTVELPCKRDGVKQRLDQMAVQLRKLPLRKKHHDDEFAPHQPAVDDNKPVALIVEDQSDVARLVGLVLDELCTVYYATDGEQGLAKAFDLMPDLVVSDVKMPLMDGLEMCRLMRKNEQLRHIPVIMLSARTSDADRIRGIDAGADAYLLKPFVREELVAWAKRLMDDRRHCSVTQAEQPALEQLQESESVAVDAPCTDSTADSAADEKFLASFAQEVETQFSTGSKKVVLDVIAVKFRMGETQLRRKVQSLTGKNVPAYITQLRMEKAMRLLRESPDSLIGEIAEQCGFQDVAYFSRVFRQYYGMTPTQARNQ